MESVNLSAGFVYGGRGGGVWRQKYVVKYF